MRRFLGLAILSGLLLGYPSYAQLPPAQEKSILVKRMIELNHYSPRAVDDTFSLGMFKTMINAADPRRLLFTDNEYKTLSAFRFKLDDELKGNGWAFLDQFTALYKKALTRADSLLGASFQKPF